MLIKLNGQPFRTTESMKEELKESYANNQKAQKHMKNSIINILMGNWKPNVGAEKVDGVIRPYGLGIRNHRG